ncbi:MAG TPA: diaminopimelate epimerase [Vicinamibacterales bacterium]|nr:diaminopimelate epimerase [Vicinamibacterales bacterium]
MRALRLIKTHAFGNDFLLAASEDVDTCLGGGDVADLARDLCNRHRGLGADGLMLLTPTADGASTRLWNADGSVSEVSGNGVRCAAAWLAHERRTPIGGMIVIDSVAGPKRLTLLAADGLKRTFRAEMGPPAELRKETIDVNGTSIDCVVLRVGNPQCVVLGEVTEARLHSIAAALAVHPFFPQGTNVELATVEAPDRVRILIWERGVGPTEASGTGACASAVAAAFAGGAGRAVDVLSPGGVQHVEWTTDTIWLTGWAVVVAECKWWLT